MTVMHRARRRLCLLSCSLHLLDASQIHPCGGTLGQSDSYPGQPCMFPFAYPEGPGGKMYYQCISKDWEQPWCFVDKAGNWGNCECNKNGPAPGMLEPGTLKPPHVYPMEIGMGRAKFVRFTCDGGPADAWITLSTYAQRSDPLLFVSLNPDEPPTYSMHHASSFDQWKEDSAGNRYVVAKGVGPRGGIVSVVNVKNFAGQVLSAHLSIKCSYYVAFDPLFWDHLKSEEVCPVGPEPQAGYCSGHGICGKHGKCDCDGDWAGTACEHEAKDLFVAAHGAYEFGVATGKYTYFRIRVPPRFPGGFLNAEMESVLPLVVVVSSDGLPTKSHFETSNFDDWINGRNFTKLRFKVKPSDSADDFGGVPSRLLAESEDLLPWQPRLLQMAPDSNGACPQVAPSWESPACQKRIYGECESSCMRCIRCVKGHRKEREQCTVACNECKSPSCLNVFSDCAGSETCGGFAAQKCEATCGACIGCVGSSDPDCSNCQCCSGCLPLAAKCDVLAPRAAEQERFIFVGVFNHRWYYNDESVVPARVLITLDADENYNREIAPKDWVASLWDPFHDMQSLELSMRKIYPGGHRFIYDLPLGSGIVKRKKVRIYKDRMTLLHLRNEGRESNMQIAFLTGTNVSHVLSSTRASPKTLFDFDQILVQTGSRVELRTRHQLSVWIALFGIADGEMDLTISTYDNPDEVVSLGFTTLLVVGFLGGIICLGLFCGNTDKVAPVIGGMVSQVGELAQSMPSVALSERFSSLRPGHTDREASGLMREGSYMGSGDTVDRSAEDRYLKQRGGALGDDGI